MLLFYEDLQSVVLMSMMEHSNFTKKMSSFYSFLIKIVIF